MLSETKRTLINAIRLIVIVPAIAGTSSLIIENGFLNSHRDVEHITFGLTVFLYGLMIIKALKPVNLQQKVADAITDNPILTKKIGDLEDTIKHNRKSMSETTNPESIENECILLEKRKAKMEEKLEANKKLLERMEASHVSL